MEFRHLIHVKCQYFEIKQHLLYFRISLFVTAPYTFLTLDGVNVRPPPFPFELLNQGT